MSLKASLLRVLPSFARQPIRRAYYLASVVLFKKTDELRLLSSFVKKGDHVIDVGANIGIYTKALSELVGSGGRVYSIEPIPSTFDILQVNVAMLALHNVVLCNYAASNSDAMVHMSMPGDDFYRAEISGMNALSISITSRKLDSAMIGSKISFLKIDVEGHELQVILGAMGIIKSSKPAMLIEITRDPEDKSSDAFLIFTLLKGLGYRIFWLDGMYLREYYPKVKSVNYFFIP